MLLTKYFTEIKIELIIVNAYRSADNASFFYTRNATFGDTKYIPKISVNCIKFIDSTGYLL